MLYIYIEKFLKGIVKSILICIAAYLLFAVSYLVIGEIKDYFSRTDGLQYAYRLMNSKKFIGMEYSECCDLLQDAEEKYENFYFLEEYDYIEESGCNVTMNGSVIANCREYFAGYADDADGRDAPYKLKVYFSADNKVIGANIFER